ncbi:HTH-like domain protein [Anoxybacillus sp. B7M1]|jgi:hypothetical protein|nr:MULTISPECIES: IS3 family transposase [unclassified Anoxybacillus]ANB59142.1 HTH-like domain protein [Anoxybacillus sp. B2M1]ANB62789.1 HTH-like domain protein [Anoxybacillus sp. B7M1]
MEWQPWVICIGLPNLLSLASLAKEPWLQGSLSSPGMANFNRIFIQPKQIYILQYSALFSCKKHCKIYGSPKMTQELRKQGIRVSQKTVARIMSEEGLRPITTYRIIY